MEQYLHLWWVPVLLFIIVAQAAIFSNALRRHTVLRRQRIIAILGITWCVISLWIEKSLENAPEFSPLCDFSSWAKCSSFITSSYYYPWRHWSIVSPGHALDLSSPILGIAFYTFHLLHSLLKKLPLLGAYIPFITFIATTLALIATCYEACILLFVLQNFCVICVSLHFCNFYLWKSVTDSFQQRKIN